MIAALVLAGECWLNPVLGVSMLEAKRDLVAGDEGRYVGRAPLDRVDVFGEPTMLFHLTASPYVDLKGASLLAALGLQGMPYEFETWSHRSAGNDWPEGIAVTKIEGLKEGWRLFLGVHSATLVGPPLAEDFRAGVKVADGKIAPKIADLMKSASWNSAIRDIGRPCYAGGLGQGRLEIFWKSSGAFQDVGAGFDFGKAKSKMPEAKGEAGLIETISVTFEPGKAKTWRDALRLVKLADSGASASKVDDVTTELTGIAGVPSGWTARVFGKNEVDRLKFTRQGGRA